MLYDAAPLHDRAAAYTDLSRHLLAHRGDLDPCEVARRKGLARLLTLWSPGGDYDAASILILADAIDSEVYTATSGRKTWARLDLRALHRAVRHAGAAELAAELAGFYYQGGQMVNRGPGDDGEPVDVKLSPDFARQAIADWWDYSGSEVGADVVVAA